MGKKSIKSDYCDGDWKVKIEIEMTILWLICFGFHAISKPFSRPKIFFLKKVFNHFCKLLSDIHLLCFSFLANFWYTFFLIKVYVLFVAWSQTIKNYFMNVMITEVINSIYLMPWEVQVRSKWDEHKATFHCSAMFPCSYRRARTKSGLNISIVINATLFWAPHQFHPVRIITFGFFNLLFIFLLTYSLPQN